MASLGLVRLIGLAGAGILLAAGPVCAQVRTIDPNSANADLAPVPSSDAGYSTPAPPPPAPASTNSAVATPAPDVQSAAPAAVTPPATADAAAANTYHREDVISAAEGVFGKGAEGLASLIEKILKDQGEPNGYIAGREASGAFVVGLRYGSGVMTHKVEGQRPVYWTGPSIGFDAGGDANKVFVLVYNLYDSQELYRRFPGAEGRLYLVGGFAATYLRAGNVVLIPVRLGVGWRAGVNVGYMKFTEKAKWMPF